MDVILVAAVAENGVIGSAGKLPWRLPKDIAHFRRLTWGKCVVMGRKTHESIGRALPGRVNMVVTRNPNYSAHGCVVTHSLEEAITLAATLGYGEVVVIGGAALYVLAIPLATIIHLTRVRSKVAGDTFFPTLDEVWTELSCEEHLADSEHGYAFAFYTLTRTNK